MQPDEIVIKKKDYIKIHENLVNPTDITKEEVNTFHIFPYGIDDLAIYNNASLFSTFAIPN